MRIAVAGGTGVVGRHVVDAARERGHDVVVLARPAGVDLRTGAGLAGALRGVDAVVDTLNVATQRRATAVEFFTATTVRLLAAEAEAGVGHHVVLSIVGVDDMPIGYYAGKLAQERAAVEGPVPWSILRATQFHEFAEQVLGFAAVSVPGLGRVSVVPRMLSQPVAAHEVGVALVDRVERGPGGRLPDLAGPERLWMHDLARRVVRARGSRQRVLAVPLPGAAGRGMRDGHLCPAGEHARGVVSFGAWLAACPADPSG